MIGANLLLGALLVALRVAVPVTAQTCPRGEPTGTGHWRGAGSFCTPKWGQCGTGEYSGGGDIWACQYCYDCDAGKYMSTEGHNDRSCNTCPAGTFQSNTGASTCCYCPSGKYDDSSRRSCNNCPRGKYSPEGSDSSSDCYTVCGPGQHVSGSRCQPCEAGRALSRSDHTETSCTRCRAGSSQDETGQTRCHYCSYGQYQPSEGRSSCIACGTGHYQPSSGSTSCTSCPAGKEDTSDRRSCRDCDAGKQDTSSRESCADCPAGTQDTSDRTTCTNCPAGTQDTSDRATCATCSAGQYDRSDRTACTTCADGRYSASGSDSESDCKEICGGGQYLSGNECQLCAAGQYQSDSDHHQHTSCIACPAGKEDTSHRLGCTDCAAYGSVRVGYHGPCETDPCYRDLGECNEPHPAAVCALPASLGRLGQAQECTTINAYDNTEGVGNPGDCDSFVANGTLVCGVDVIFGGEYAGYCNLACSINLYDSVHGAGQCDALIAAGSVSCAGNLAAGGDYAGYCDISCEFCECSVPPGADESWCPAPPPPPADGRTVDERSCVSSELQVTWARGREPQTPAQQYPSTRDACTAGLAAVIERTRSWLEVAEDYRTQAAEASAGIVAQQLCLESRFQRLRCLGPDSPSLQDLTALHSQACAMSDSIGKGHSVDMLLSTSDVPPLTFSQYSNTFDAVQDYMETLQTINADLTDSSDFHSSLSQEVAVDAANAVDEAGIFRANVEAEARRMDVYRAQIRGIDRTIQLTLQSMQLDGTALIQSVSDQINASKESFQSASSHAPLQPEERAILEARAADLQAQQQETQQRLGEQLPEEERPQLEHRLNTITQLLTWIQQRLSDASGTAAPSVSQTCSADCVGRVLPSSNGCGTDFTGQFHSWAITAMAEVTGCYSVPYLMNDMQPCCDAHDLCYGSCGVTQAFCDQQLHDCMQAQASLPECETTIEVSSLLVDMLGCDHFIDAQEESVEAQCRNSDANQGCVGSCSDESTCIEIAERVCETVGALAGAITANPVGNAVCTGIDIAGDFATGIPLPPGNGICHQFLAGVQAASRMASYALSVVDDNWGRLSSWFGRRLQDACGDLDSVTCRQMLEQQSRLQSKLRSAKRMIATVSSLANLNTQLLSEEEIDPAALAKLDMTFLDLDMWNDQLVAESFSAALGDTAATYETEVRQLVTLIRSKLEQTRVFYEAALSKHDSEQRQELLGRRAARASEVVEQERDRATQLAVTRDFFDAKLRTYSHIGLEWLIKEARAYEYLFLQEYTGLDLDRLRMSPMSGSDYFQFVAQAQADLQQAFSRTASQFNNAGGSSVSGTTFRLADLPAARDTFVQTGEITLSISLPEDSIYYGVTFSDIRVFLIGLPATERTPVTINLIKKGTSVFKDRRGEQRRFTHDESNPPLQFMYDAQRCTTMRSSDTSLQSGNMRNIYIRYSPYGTWKLQVVGASNLQLDAVTGIRFDFSLQSYPGRFAGRPVFFSDGTPYLGELGLDACIQDGSGARAQRPPPAPPPSPPLSPMVQADGEPQPCTSYPEFTAYTQAANVACCDDPAAPCAAGLPTACSIACASVLLPMQSACSDYLTLLGVKNTIDDAAATCPAPLRLAPCTNYAEFMAYTQHVTAACCDADAACVAGLPTDACSSACKDVLLPMQSSCTSFLAVIGMQDTIDSAAATCAR